LQVGENYHSLPLVAILSSPFFLSRTTLFSSVQRAHGCKQGAAAPMDGAQALLLPQASGALIPPCAAPLFLYLQQQEASTPLHFPPRLFPLFFLYVRRVLPSWPSAPLLPWRRRSSSSQAPNYGTPPPSSLWASSSIIFLPPNYSCHGRFFPMPSSLIQKQQPCAEPLSQEQHPCRLPRTTPSLASFRCAQGARRNVQQGSARCRLAVLLRSEQHAVMPVSGLLFLRSPIRDAVETRGEKNPRCPCCLFSNRVMFHVLPTINFCVLSQLVVDVALRALSVR
jgi:hypothetical protein